MFSKMPVSSYRQSLHHVSRWIIGLISILTSSTLVFFSYKNYSRVSEVKKTLVVALTKSLTKDILSKISDPKELSKEDLLKIIAESTPDEITYLAIFYNGEAVLESGQTSKHLPQYYSFHEGPFSINVQERVVQVLTPLHRFHPLPPRGPEIAPAGLFRPEEIHGGWLMFFEFVPMAALQLVGGALRSLLVSIFASVILLLATALFWFLSFQTEKRAKDEAARKRLEALGEMTAVLGHELRNPLASLKGHAQLLQEGLSPGDPGIESLNMVIKEAKRLEYLTNHILNFARPNTHEPCSFELNALLQEAASSFPSDNNLQLVEAAEKYTIWGDPFKLRQALINLFLNAFQAAPDKVVECHLHAKGNSVHIEIRDHGDGISAEHFPHLFEPYFTTKTRGTGLGLAIVKSTIEEFGGTISAANHPEGGALFVVTLPLA